ncbi:MAG: DUF411 domain-containing protein [Halopseudomonas sp.]
MKKAALTTTLLATSIYLTTPALAENPAWKQGKTETAHDITVYHSPSCGCCKGWIDHLKEHNFNVKSIEMDNVDPIKQQHGVPQQTASCHTAVIDGKVIEGHVPAQDIKALLASSNDTRLLAVPGMPSGGPGMDWKGARQDAFKVYAQSHDGKISVFRDYQDY